MIGSPRAVFAKTLVGLLRAARGGAYHVHRGPVDWSTFSFSEHPSAIAVVIDESTFLQQAMYDNPVSARVTIDALVPLRGDHGMDDDAIDVVIDDVTRAVLGLFDEKYQPTEDLVFKIDGRQSRLKEVVDTGLGVQGVIATLHVEF
jgi:hypothetical protein